MRLLSIRDVLLTLNESNKIVNNIYSLVDINDFPNQCHYMVNEIKDILGNVSGIEYVFWDEGKWGEVADRLKENNKKFNVREIDNLIEDISDFSVNGHSFIKVNNGFADPYLYNLGVKQSKIEEFDKYLYGIYKKVGVI